MNKLDKTTHIQIAIKLGMERPKTFQPWDINVHNEVIDGVKEWYVSLSSPKEKDITIWKSVCEEAYFDALYCKAKNRRFTIMGELIEITTVQPLWSSKNNIATYININ